MVGAFKVNCTLWNLSTEVRDKSSVVSLAASGSTPDKKMESSGESVKPGVARGPLTIEVVGEVQAVNSPMEALSQGLRCGLFGWS